MSIDLPVAPTRPAALHASAHLDWREFRLGWRILVLSMLGVAISATTAMLYAFGAMVIPLQKAFGWNRGDMQFAISFLFAGAVVSAQLVGWLNLRYGIRRVTVASVICLSLSIAAMPLMGSSIGWLYLFYALLPIAGLGTMQVTWTFLVNLWFERNRGLGLALMLSGTGLAAALIPSIVTAATERWGWQSAYLILAALPVLLVLPLALRWMRLPPAAAAVAQTQPSRGTSADTTLLPGIAFGRGIRSAKFWFLNIALTLVVAAVVLMVTNIVPLLRDKGLSAGDASKVFGAFGVSLICGRLLVGYLVDHLWAPGVAAVAIAMPALGCFLLWVSGAPDTGALVLATALVGIGAGAEFDVAAYLVSRYFGLRDYGRLFGIHVGVTTAGAASATWVAGSLYKATGSYSTMLALCAGAFVIGALMLLPLGRYPKFS